MADETNNAASGEKPWWMPDPFQQTVTLADGTVLNGKAARTTEGDELWVWLEPGTSFEEAFGHFINPEKTATITTQLSKIEQFTYHGYTKLDQLKRQGERIVLRMLQP